MGWRHGTGTEQRADVMADSSSSSSTIMLQTPTTFSAVPKRGFHGLNTRRTWTQSRSLHADVFYRTLVLSALASCVDEADRIHQAAKPRSRRRSG